ncbi:MAG TPA: DUF6113 family protein [Streptosporangiaceae bacterium]
MNEEVRGDVPARPDGPDLPSPPDPTPPDPSAPDPTPPDPSAPDPSPSGPAAGAQGGVPQTHGEAFVTGGAYGALAVGGAMLGVAGSFYQGIDAGPVPLLAIVFAALNLIGFRLSGWAMGTRLGAVAPTVGWLVVVIFMSSRRPEGDLVISGSAAGYIYLLGGTVAALTAIARTPSVRGWILPNDPQR